MFEWYILHPWKNNHTSRHIMVFRFFWRHILVCKICGNFLPKNYCIFYDLKFAKNKRKTIMCFEVYELFLITNNFFGKVFFMSQTYFVFVIAKERFSLLLFRDLRRTQINLWLRRLRKIWQCCVCQNLCTSFSFGGECTVKYVFHFCFVFVLQFMLI